MTVRSKAANGSQPADPSAKLARYRAKRDFDVTPEPAGTEAAGREARSTVSTGRFVVQRHRATALHYDFRLEAGGVLKSWAIPRGPSRDPRLRRLAVQVEDHPLDHFDFEGVIPRDQYGAGDVIVWDWGTYTADPETHDAEGAMADGEFKFVLDGVKLDGAFVLVRTANFGPRRTSDESSARQKWLLIKRRDDHVVAGWDAEDEPHSVKSGRTNDEVAAGRRHRNRV